MDTLFGPYFDFSDYGLTRQDAEPMENVSRFGQVVTGLAQWEETLERLASRTIEGDDLDGEGPPGLSQLPEGVKARTLLESLRRIAGRLLPLPPQTLRRWVDWVEAVLADLNYFQLNADRREGTAFQGLQETLDALPLSDSLFAKEDLYPYGRFLDELEGALRSAGRLEAQGGRESAIAALPLLQARGLRYHAVAVLGLSEGIFPEVERADPFFDEAMRQNLKLEPRLGREQTGLFYQAATRTDSFILLTRPYLADDGENWEPSPFWNAVEDLFSDKAQRIRPDDPRPLTDAASPQEVLFWNARRFQSDSRADETMPEAFAALTERWSRLQRKRKILNARLAEVARGPYEGDLNPLAEVLTARYSPDHVWSPSRLESYGTCPHRFYTEVVLTLSPREEPELGFDALQLGSMLHQVLETAYRQASDPTDPDSVIRELKDTAEEEFRSAPERYGFRPNVLWEIERDHLYTAQEGTIQELDALEEGWIPFAYERRFGLGGAPPLLIDSSGESIRLRGVIDRLDRNTSGELRVVDYKTGSSHLRKNDLVDGRRLQLPLYGLAAKEALGLGKPVEGIYWSLSSRKPGGLKLSAFRHESYHGPGGAIQMAVDHTTRIVQGARQGHFPPIPPDGGCPSYCPASAWCWRYSPSRS
jgi:RecB family exonuclease